MARKTGLAKALARRGVENLVTVAGWETRGSSYFAPFGTLDHWTAGPRTGLNPSLNVCIYGRPGLPGPLAQVMLGRASTFLIAAGRANHAGRGFYAGADGNTDLFGLEIEWSGAPGELNEYQLRQVPRINAAFRDLGSRFEAGHDEYALPRGRKVDIGATIHKFRADTAKVLAGTTTPTARPVPEEDIMATLDELRQVIREEATAVAEAVWDHKFRATHSPINGTRIPEESAGVRLRELRKAATYTNKVAADVDPERKA